MKPFTCMKTYKKTNNQVIQEQIIGLRQDKLGRGGPLFKAK